MTAIRSGSSSRQKRFTELVVVPSTHTETVLPMQASQRDRRDVEEQTSVPRCTLRLLMKLPGIANVRLDAEL